ncbi:MAG TPA: DUF5615 family PIN-like protein, partial [Ktedonobacterales bacterium]
LPRRLTHQLRAAGHDALHTLDLPHGNRSTDTEINLLSVQEKRVVITKDSDFVNSFILNRQPYKLLLISTGNIKNSELEALLFGQLERVITKLTTQDFVELTRTSLIIHV